MKLISYSSGLKFYDRMPPGMKGVMATAMKPIPRRMLFGNGFREHLEGLKRSESHSVEELERYQLKLLCRLLDHADRNVPYYHDLFRAEGFDPRNVNSLETLKHVPVLTKDIIRKEYRRLTAVDSASYHPGEANTTGSTGRPLQFLLDQQNREIEHASVWRHYLWSGITGLDARIASFRGDFVSERGSKVLWRWDGRIGELTFNTYALEKSNIVRMVEKLNRYRPEVIRGYPHSLYILSKGMEASGASLTFAPRFIHTSSEQLPAFMRESIEAAFHSTIRDWYGQSEYVISAGECSEGNYHQTMETGIIGLEEDAWGMERLIGTGLWNMSMPFINYDIGDHVLVGGDDCPCGRKHLILRSIEGRVNDVIITADGTALSGVGIDNYYEKEVLPALNGTPEFLKLVQEGIGTFTIETYRSGGIEDRDLERISNLFQVLLGGEAGITIKVLNALPDLRKWKNVESRLSTEAIARLLQERNY